MRVSSFLSFIFLSFSLFGQQSIVVDYDKIDEYAKMDSGGSYERFIWKLDSDYVGNDSSYDIVLNWAVVAFDSLYDAVGMRPYQSKSTSFVIDSLDVRVLHLNHKGTPDSIIISAYEWFGAYGVRLNAQEKIINNILYDTTIIVSSSLSPNSFAVVPIRIYPNVSLSAPYNRFLVGIHFRGDTANSFSLYAGHGNYGCGIYCASESVFFPNSLFKMASIPDYDGPDLPHVRCSSPTCNEYFLQNFAFSAYLNVNALSVVVSSSPSFCNDSSGVAASSVLGGSGDYSFIWSNGNTMDSVIYGLPSGNYKLTVVDAIAGLSGYAQVFVGDYCDTINTGTSANDLFELEVVPNPGTGFFTLHSRMEVYRLTVIDRMGKVIVQLFPAKNINGRIQIDLSDEPNGVYLVKAESQRKNIIKKVVLLK